MRSCANGSGSRPASLPGKLAIMQLSGRTRAFAPGWPSTAAGGEALRKKCIVAAGQNMWPVRAGKRIQFTRAGSG